MTTTYVRRRLVKQRRGRVASAVDEFVWGIKGEKLRRRAERSLGWSKALSGIVLEEYKKFLTVKLDVDRDGSTLAAPILVDALWELHILDTRAYRELPLYRDPDQEADTNDQRERRLVTKTAVAERFACDGKVWEIN